MISDRRDAKDRILIVARKLFATQGYDATTLRQISEAAGTNVAMISYYFGGKENLYSAIFEEYSPMPGLSRELRQYVEKPAEGIRLLVEKLREIRKDNPEMLAIIQHEIMMNRCCSDVYREHILPVCRCLKSLLYSGREQGVFQFQSVNSTLLFLIVIITLPFHDMYFKRIKEELGWQEESDFSEALQFIFSGIGYSGSYDGCAGQCKGGRQLGLPMKYASEV